MSHRNSPNEQPEELQQEASRKIQKCWRSYVTRRVFRQFVEVIGLFNQSDPKTILKTVNPREGELLDAAAGAFIKFRLGGITFPPHIYYKIFTHRPIADLCAFSPKTYTQQHHEKFVGQEGQSRWYQRMEYNNWRLFSNRLTDPNDPTESGTDQKKMDFHYSRLQRQEDSNKWRRKRKIEWLKQMYHLGQLQLQEEQKRRREEENEEDEMLDLELEEFLTFTSILDFEDYIEEWKQLAISYSSEMKKDEPVESLKQLDIRDKKSLV